MMNVTRERVELDIQRVLEAGQACGPHIWECLECDERLETLNALEDILADLDEIERRDG